MDRRRFLAGFAAGTVLRPSRLLSASPDLRSAARDAWLFGLPLIEMARTRWVMFRPRWHPINTIGHKRQLATPADQLVTTPNNDTLYSASWIDLASGPVTITLPRTGRRYFSVALMDMYSNNFAVLGTRTTGADGGTFVLEGPQSKTAHSIVLRRTRFSGRSTSPALQVEGHSAPFRATPLGTSILRSSSR